MNPDFLELLVHPRTKEKLRMAPDQPALKALSDPELFFLVEGVPVLLQKQSGSNEETFNYREHYEKDAETYDYFAGGAADHRVENHRLHQQIVNVIPPDASWILDVGCGGAWLAKTCCPQGRNVISMDISTRNPVKAVQTVASPHHFGLVADVYALPVKENSIDCIVASEIIEHVQDPKSFLRALCTALKPGGTLIVTTPYNEKIQQSLCIHCNRLTPHNAHIHSFTRAGLAQIAPPDASSVHTRTFNNKILTVLRIDKLLQTLPFPVWRLIDGTANRLFDDKALRLMLCLKK